MFKNHSTKELTQMLTELELQNELDESDLSSFNRSCTMVDQNCLNQKNEIEHELISRQNPIQYDNSDSSEASENEFNSFSTEELQTLLKELADGHPGLLHRRPRIYNETIPHHRTQTLKDCEKITLIKEELYKRQHPYNHSTNIGFYKLRAQSCARPEVDMHHPSTKIAL